MRIIIVGGVAAGTKTAAKLKRELPDAEVLIFEKGKEISYAGCGLPYYVGGTIKEREELIVNTPKDFEVLTGSKVIMSTEIVSVDPDAKTVEAVHIETQKREFIGYDKLILAVGAHAICPPIEGIKLKNVFFLRTPDDAKVLKAAVNNSQIKRAVVVGGGFIGLEIAENIAKQSVKVTVVEAAEQVLPGFDKDIADYAELSLLDSGVVCLTGAKAESVEGTECVEKVVTSKRAIKADAVIIAIGIKPNTAFLKGSGIKLNSNGTIRINEFMETNKPDVYAVGDCAMVINYLTAKPAWAPMGSSANLEGRQIAKNIAGDKKPYRGVIGTSVVKLPKINVGKTGLGINAAKTEGYDAVSVTCVLNDKAHYYPGAGDFIIKMIADKNTLGILGVQVIGAGAVDKIVDIAVMAISFKAKLDEVTELDFAYAPPFSTAIHPFAAAANILLNKIKGIFNTFTPLEYMNGDAEGYKVIDVSTLPAVKDAEYHNLTEITGPIANTEKKDKLLLVCSRGKRAYFAQRRLKAMGYTETKVLEGGTEFNQIKND